MRDDTVTVIVDERRYRAEEPKQQEGLRVTLSVLRLVNDGEIAVFADRLNLDSDSQRRRYAARAAGDDPELSATIAADLLRVREILLDRLFGVPPPPAGPEPVVDDTGVLALLRSGRLLEQVVEAVAGLGYAGNARLVKLLYLVMTSRLLPRPINVLVSGPSAVGKTLLVTTVAKFFPPEATYALTGLSERLLAYTDASLERRVLLIAEVAALARDGIGASLLRAVAWDNKIAYDTVEKSPEGLRARRIEKNGPTSFITTSTGGLEAELETRVLTLTAPESPDDTRFVLRALGERANGLAPGAPDLTPLITVQRWLAERGTAAVTIPFAPHLAERYPNRQIRARRDFTQLLTLVAAHALLHQELRDRDEHDRIVADGRDYEAIYDLAGPVFAAIAAEGLTPEVRAAVEAVRAIITGGASDVSVARLASALKIDKGTCSRRVRRAIAGGWLINEETRRGLPAVLKLGDDLPGEHSALPDPDDVLGAE